jgi:hypothetical protein
VASGAGAQAGTAGATPLLLAAYAKRGDQALPLARQPGGGGGAPPAAPAPAAAPAAPGAGAAGPAADGETLPVTGDARIQLSAETRKYPLALGDLREFELGVGKLVSDDIPIGETGITAQVVVGSNSPLRLARSELELSPVTAHIEAAHIKRKREVKEGVTKGLGAEGAAIGGIVGGLVGWNPLGGLVGLPSDPLSGAEQGGLIGGRLGESLAEQFVGEQTLEATLVEGALKGRFVLLYNPYLTVILGVPILKKLVSVDATLQTQLSLEVNPFLDLAKSKIALHFRDGRLVRSEFTLNLKAGLGLGLTAFGALRAGITILHLLDGSEQGENVHDEGLLSLELGSTGVFPMFEDLRTELSGETALTFLKGSPLEIPSKRVSAEKDGVTKATASGMKANLGKALGGRGKGEPPPAGARLHAGTKADPVPMIWYKPVDLYPKVLHRPWGERWENIHAFPHRVYPVRPSHQAVDPLEAGVDGVYWPWKGKHLTREKEPRVGEAEAFRKQLEAHGIQVKKSWQMDHVQDVQFGGPDEFDNVWPFEGDVNMAAGTWHANQTVPWRDPDVTDQRLGVALSKTRIGTVFVIADIQPPPSK